MSSHKRARLAAEPRSGVHKKSALRLLRRSGNIPALIYGHGDPVPVQLSARELTHHLRYHAPGVLVDLDLGDQSTTALIRELDRDPVTGQIVHLGFQRIDLKERIRANVPQV